MYSTQHAVMSGQPQGRSVAPETFLLDQDAQQSLPPDSVVALQQVDNRMSSPHPFPNPILSKHIRLLSNGGLGPY